MNKTHAVLAGAVIVLLGGGAALYFHHVSSAEESAEQPSADLHLSGDMAMPDDTHPPGGAMPMNMQPADPPAVTDAQQAELDAGAAPHAPATLTFDVNGGNFYFVPKEIRVKKGDTVTVNFIDDGGFHDFNIDELGVKIGPLKDAGQSSSATFVADKAGSFQYYCSIGHHRDNGMWGTLIVE